MSSSEPPRLVYAVREIAFYVYEVYQEIDFRDIFYNLVVPLLVTLLGTAASLQLFIFSKRCIFPPTTAELHREALLVYQSGDYQETERLLCRILKRNSNYTPARLSLIALYLYVTHNLSQAQTLLQDGSGSEFQPLEMDLQALQQGQDHMVHSILRQDEYLSVRAADNV